MNRDNFSASVVRKLKDRVNSLCSNPNCRATTQAPAGDDSVNNIGVAAHIAAASLGGPRYDHKMTATQRASIGNAIWLCANCSIKIDRDPELYPVELLKDWRSFAEKSAKKEQGKKLPNQSDTIDTLTQALTGFPKSFIASSISNIHRANEIALERLDPRFKVKSQFVNGVNEFYFSAIEPVDLTFFIDPSAASVCSNKLKGLIEHGIDFSFPANLLNIEGSALFSALLEDKGGLLTISSEKTEAIQKIWLVDKKTKIIENFDDVKGFISLGSKGFLFSGVACNGVLEINYSGPINGNGSVSKLNVTLDYEKWNSLNMKKIPYLNKLYDLFYRLNSGWQLHSSIEIDGVRVLSFGGESLKGNTFIEDMAGFLSYVAHCSKIAKKNDIDFFFNSNISYSANEHKKIIELAKGVTGFIRQPIKAELEVKGKEAVSECLSLTEPFIIKLDEPLDEKIDIFGVPLVISNRITTVKSVLARYDGDIDSISDGKKITVFFDPLEDTKTEIQYKVFKV